LENEDSDLVFKWNDKEATFLHYACLNQNIEVLYLFKILLARSLKLNRNSYFFFCVIKLAKLLLDVQRERDIKRVSADLTTSTASSLLSNCHQLKKLLEAPFNKIGDTILLRSCYHVDYAMVELLVDAGADMTCTNLEGNTAIHMLAACLRKGNIPSKELFPCIAQVKQPIIVL